MVSIPGVDYPWTHPSAKALQDAGKKFACRYLSRDTEKNLSLAEARDLAAHGMSSVVVWETTANRALSGRTGGIADARAAALQATACGMPSGRPVYFATDWDVTEAQQSVVNAYLDGAGSVIGKSWVGVYGGYYAVKRALDGGHAEWGWQTFAWSGGQWDSRAVIRQGNQAKIGGVTVDLDTALAADYGQWTPGELPEEADVALTDADKTWIKGTVTAAAQAAVRDLAYPAVVQGDKVPAPLPDAKNPAWTMETYLRQLYLRVLEVKAGGSGDSGAPELIAAVNDLRASVDQLRTAVTDPSGFLDKLSAELAQYTVKFEKEA